MFRRAKTRLSRVWNLRLLALALALAAFVLQTLKDVLGEFKPPRSLNLALIGVAVAVAAASYFVQRAEKRRSAAGRLAASLLYWPLRTVREVDCSAIGSLRPSRRKE